jgi:hypothetical protein
MEKIIATNYPFMKIKVEKLLEQIRISYLFIEENHRETSEISYFALIPMILNFVNGDSEPIDHNIARYLKNGNFKYHQQNVPLAKILEDEECINNIIVSMATNFSNEATKITQSYKEALFASNAVNKAFENLIDSQKLIEILETSQQTEVE